MKSNNRAFIIFIVLILITTLACNISIEGAAPEGANLELTVTAQALLLQQPVQNSAPAVIAESPTATFTLVAEATPTTGGSGVIAATSTTSAGGSGVITTTFTSTSGTVTVTVSAETNCRTGPAISFSSNYSLPVGQIAEVIGKNTLTNYWIIKIPGGGGTTCWLWGKYATVSGNTNGLAEFATPTPAPTAIPTPPAAVSGLSEQHTCANGNDPSVHNVTGTITWKDNSNNENGFNIYSSATFASGQQPDVLIGSAGPNSTTYAFNIETLNGVSFLIRVEAFNDIGASARKSINIAYNCP